MRKPNFSFCERSSSREGYSLVGEFTQTEFVESCHSPVARCFLTGILDAAD
jgi:hypothetical protein